MLTPVRCSSQTKEPEPMHNRRQAEKTKDQNQKSLLQLEVNSPSA